MNQEAPLLVAGRKSRQCQTTFNNDHTIRLNSELLECDCEKSS